MKNLYEKIGDSVDKVERDEFKDYVIERFREVSSYIKKVKMSSVNSYGQWGIHIYCYDTLDKLTGRFNKGYSTYIPNDADDLTFEWAVEEVKAIYEDPRIKMMKD